LAALSLIDLTFMCAFIGVARTCVWAEKPKNPRKCIQFRSLWLCRKTPLC